MKPARNSHLSVFEWRTLTGYELTPLPCQKARKYCFSSRRDELPYPLLVRHPPACNERCTIIAAPEETLLYFHSMGTW